MTYYFFDTSAMIGIFRRQQLRNKSGEMYWMALNESANPDGVGCGAPRIVICHLMPYEMLRMLFLKNQSADTIMEMMKAEIEQNSWTKIEITKEILKNASELMEKHNILKSYDALQLACALKAKKDYENLIFVTNDETLEGIAKQEGLTTK